MYTEAKLDKKLLEFEGAKLDFPFGKDVAVYRVFVPRVSHVDGAQGASEQANEPYMGYVEEAAERATKRSTTSAGRVPGSARKQASAMRGEWKMFALVAVGSQPVRLSLKCDPQLAEVLRKRYVSVLPGYHLNKRHWNTIVLAEKWSKNEIDDLINHSYQLVTGHD